MEMIMMDQAPASSLLPTELPSLVSLLGGHDAQQMILVQVNPGETFTIQAEDGSLQCIQGPAHVPMVSTNGSIPPIHVPPGYISQIIEDNGLWKVVVTPHSPDFHPHHHSLHPGPPPLPPYMPHHPPPLMTQHPHPMYPTPVPPGTPGDLQPFMAHAPPPPHTIYEHESLPPPLRQNFYSERSIGKLHDRPPKKCKPERNTISERPGSKDKATSPPSSPQNKPRASSPAKNLDCSSPLPPSHTLSGVTRPVPNSSPASIPPLSPAHSLSSSNDVAQPLHNGCVGRVASPVQSLRSTVGASGLPKRPERKSRGSPRSLDTDCAGDVDTDAKRLSSSSTLISKPRLVPKLSNIQARSVVLLWSPPSQPLRGLHDSGSMVLPVCHYEVSLCDVGRDSRWHLVYSGDELEVRLSDLQPASDYHARVQAICDTWRDLTSDLVAFKTSGCAPDTPSPPSLLQRTRTSLFLQWKAPADNGSRISAYLLQWDEGKRGIVFKECYHGNQKQCKMTRLAPAGSYSFRLAACNSMGTSGYSEEVSFVTAGTPPTPDPPRLSRAGPSWLTLHWVRPSQATHSDVLTYTLEMEEEGGFQARYSGPELSCVVRGIRKGCKHRFRLLASSADGRSSPSDLATFWTSHDRPPAPPRPSIRSPLLPHAAVICWEPPKDYGMDILKYQLEMSHGHNGARWEVVYSGSAREYLCDHLKPGSHYQLRILCHTTTGFSQSSEVLNVEIPAVPPSECTPPCLRAPAQPDQLELEWDAPENSGGAPILEYMLHMSKGGCSEPIEEKEACEVYRGPETICTVGCLLPGRAYTFCVHAANFSGACQCCVKVDIPTWRGPLPWMNLTPLCTTLLLGKCLDRMDLQLNFIKILAFIGSTNRFIEYQLAGMNDHGVYTVSLRINLNDINVVRYCLSVFEKASSAKVNWNKTSAFWLGPACHLAPKLPAPLAWANDGVEYLGVFLGKNGSVQIKKKESMQCKSLGANDENALFLFKNLVISRVKLDFAFFSVTGRLPQFEAKWQAEKLRFDQQFFLIDIKSVDLTLVPLFCRSMLEAWQTNLVLGFSGQPRYSLVFLCFVCRHSVLYSGPSHTYKVQRLQENTSYSFVIQACSTAGRGPFSAPYTYCTTRSPPPAPRSPRVAQLEGNRCQIHWDPVSGVVGEPVIYCLQVCSSRDLDFRQVYKGSQTSFQAVGLYYNCEYRFRVYAVRLCGGVSGAEMAGPSSLPITFLLRRKEIVAVAGSPTAATAGGLSTSSADGGGDRARLPGDERFAALLLLGFGACSLFIAFIMQLFIM
uniref:fibronectin type III domain-containing protein 3B-like n=1 Tax=Myxine glutinosa TaxID=7769 RepID=UPI00358FA1AC